MIDRLKAELGATPPEEFERLARADRADLAAVLAAARTQRARARADAAERVARRLPPGVRRRARKGMAP